MAFGEFVLDVVPRLERDARLARAELRQLEGEVGKSSSTDGGYWLARVAALETIAAAAMVTVQTKDVEPLRAPLRMLDEIMAPQCNPADHAKEPK